jgi:hypothetical protein
MTTSTWKSVALIVTGILIGCGTGAAGTAAAQSFAASPGAPKWQQQCIQVNGRFFVGADDLNGTLRSMGQEGWELVGIAYPGDRHTQALMCFKRPVP